MDTIIIEYAGGYAGVKLTDYGDHVEVQWASARNDKPGDDEKGVDFSRLDKRERYQTREAALCAVAHRIGWAETEKGEGA